MSTDNLKWVGQSLDNGRFEVRSKLGEGGMGYVYKAFDNALQDDVVIKVPRRSMLDDPEFKARFARENRALVKLQHPHVVSIIYVGEHDELPYVVMRFLAGGDLKQRLKQFAGTLPLDDFKSWLPQVASALDFVHEEGFIHRDVKPANILFDARGNPFLSDFGVAKVVAENQKSGESLTGAGMLLGTPEYMAPEMIQCEEYTGHVDQYALAVSVYELLCGRVPFDGPTPQFILVQQSVGVIEAPAIKNPAVPAAVSDVVMYGLAKDPSQRYPSCAAFAEAFVHAIAYSGSQVLPVPPADQLGTSGSSASHYPLQGSGSGVVAEPGSGGIQGLPPGSGPVAPPPPLPADAQSAETPPSGPVPATSGGISAVAAADDTFSNRGSLAATAAISVDKVAIGKKPRARRTRTQRRRVLMSWGLALGLLSLPSLLTWLALRTGGLGPAFRYLQYVFGRLSGWQWVFVFLCVITVTGYCGWRDSQSRRRQRLTGQGEPPLWPQPLYLTVVSACTFAVGFLLIGNTGTQAATGEVALTDVEHWDAVPEVTWNEERDVTNTLGMTLRALSPGKFRVGEEWQSRTTPLWIASQETTVAQYFKFCADQRADCYPVWLPVDNQSGATGGASTNGDSNANRHDFRLDSSKYHHAEQKWVKNAAPITGISHSQMVAFCNWLSRRAGEPFNYRLPTSAEWELAYRAGAKDPYYWGAEFDPAAKIVSGHGAPTGPDPADPLSAARNAWKLVHIAGNVHEALSQGDFAAGGAWNVAKDAAFRADARVPFDGPNPAIGFRVVAELKVQAE